MANRPAVGTAFACTLAFLAPWAILSVLLPSPWRVEALALLAAMGALLITMGAWAGRKAETLGLDSDGWVFASVVTMGYASAVLLFNPKPRPSLAYLCGECGRQGHIHEPFCFGCGSAGA
jgi:hypothetical protein